MLSPHAGQYDGLRCHIAGAGLFDVIDGETGDAARVAAGNLWDSPVVVNHKVPGDAAPSSGSGSSATAASAPEKNSACACALSF